MPKRDNSAVPLSDRWEGRFRSFLVQKRLVPEDKAKRLPKRSWVKISQIRTLAVERVGKRLGRATPEELAQAIEGLNEIIGA
jgi:mRNA-degrading endonuclease toxin of MazEF toxin-antitoxin module